MALRPNHREKATSAAASSRNGAVSGQTSALLNGLIDPTKTGKYPVLLSKALLEGTETDVFTGMRCKCAFPIRHLLVLLPIAPLPQVSRAD